MATTVVRPAPGVTVSIARDPALVRTVRLVAAAVARRAQRDEEFVEEVRLAVGEACALMMGPADDANGPVTVTMRLDAELRVEVTATGPATPGTSNPVDPEGELAAEGVEPWVLLRGLIGDFELDRSGSRTTLTMTWPAA